jgi:arsenate reductase
MMLNVLIACEYNSGRSQIACTYLNEYGSKHFTTDCGGLDPKPINPLVVLAMREEGYRIEGMNNAYSVYDLIQLNRNYDIVISVCSKEADKLFPVFPGNCRRLNWPYQNPARIAGGRLQRLQGVRDMRDRIKNDVIEFVRGYEQKGLNLFLEYSESPMKSNV